MPPRKKTPVTFDQWLGHVIDNEARARVGRAAIAGWIGNRYTGDPAPVVEEITRLVGDRTRVRDETIGVWAGFNRYEYTTTLCDALLEAFPGARAFEHVGVRRRGGIHSTGDFTH